MYVSLPHSFLLGIPGGCDSFQIIRNGSCLNFYSISELNKFQEIIYDEWLDNTFHFFAQQTAYSSLFIVC